MSLVLEGPIHEDTLNLYNWESIPLLQAKPGQKYCQKPESAYVDREKGLVYFEQGGGRDFNDEMVNYTSVLLVNKVLVTFFYNETGGTSYQDPETKFFIFTQKSLDVYKIIIRNAIFKDVNEREILEGIKSVLTDLNRQRPRNSNMQVDISFSSRIDYAYLSL